VLNRDERLLLQRNAGRVTGEIPYSHLPISWMRKLKASWKLTSLEQGSFVRLLCICLSIYLVRTQEERSGDKEEGRKGEKEGGREG
jgi:hypothetical protein